MLSDVCRHYATSGELSQTGITDGPGTLYRTIQALLRDGLTEESEDRPEADDERRRYYRITPLGRGVVAAEARRLEGLVQVARDEQLIG